MPNPFHASFGVSPSLMVGRELRLIAAELIHPTRRGYVDFALAYLREYLRDHAAADV
jgi:hypothetical protein